MGTSTVIQWGVEGRLNSGEWALMRAPLYEREWAEECVRDMREEGMIVRMTEITKTTTITHVSRVVDDGTRTVDAPDGSQPVRSTP